MKSSRGARCSSSSSSSSSTVTYTLQNDHTTPHPQTNTTSIPIDSATENSSIPITVHLQSSTPPPQTAAAVKIQSAYRAHIVRTLTKKISAVNSEANRVERLIQRQETVDAIRSDERERVKMNEALMRLLLSLDSVPGVDPTVRELRRRVSRRIVGLQEILDGVAEARVDAFGWSWDEVVEEMEEEVCRERGGDEMERFCAEHLGFRCLQRFLRDQ